MYPLHRRWLWMAAAALMVLATIVGGVMPGAYVPDTPGSDKLGHFASYFLITFWCSGCLLPRRLRWMMLALIALGAGIELVQMYLPSRSSDLADMAANVAGVALGWLAGALLGAGWGMRLEAALRGRRV